MGALSYSGLQSHEEEKGEYSPVIWRKPIDNNETMTYAWGVGSFTSKELGIFRIV